MYCKNFKNLHYFLTEQVSLSVSFPSANKPNATSNSLCVEKIDTNMKCTAKLLKIYTIFSQSNYLYQFLFNPPISQTPSDTPCVPKTYILQT